MQAPRYIEPMSDAKRYKQLSLDFHQRRLQQIKSGSFPNKIDNQLPEYLKNPIRKPTKSQGLSSVYDEIQRENESLLERISEIGKGKRQGKFRTVSERRGPRSLRDNIRRQEMRRIAEENDALMKRILNKPSTLSAKKQISEFETLRKYKQQISKSHLISASNRSKHEGRVNHLPPLSTYLVSSSMSENHFTKKESKAKSFTREHSTDSIVKKDKKAASVKGADITFIQEASFEETINPTPAPNDEDFERNSETERETPVSPRADEPADEPVKIASPASISEEKPAITEVSLANSPVQPEPKIADPAPNLDETSKTPKIQPESPGDSTPLPQKQDV